MVLTDGLLSYWPLEDNAASTTVTRSAGSQNGTASQNTNLFSSQGKINNGFYFPGSNTGMSGTRCYIGLPSNVLGSSTEFTVSSWANTQDYAYNNNILAASFNYANNKGLIIRGPRSTGFEFFLGKSSYVLTSFIASNDIWYHYILTHSGALSTLYVNGAFQESKATKTISASASYSSIGNEYTSWFKGWIDEVGFWNRALSGTEITELYNNGRGLTYPFIKNSVRVGGAVMEAYYGH